MLRQRKLWYPLAVGLLLMVTALSACGPTASTTNNSGPKQGGTIIDGVQEEANSIMPITQKLTHTNFRILNSRFKSIGVMFHFFLCISLTL